MIDFIVAHADLILALAGMSFIPSTAWTLIEQWRRRASTVPIMTSVPTAVALYLLVIVFTVLSLPFTALVDCITGSLWVAIAFQRFSYGPPQNTEELQDAAMWVVKNAEEWSDDPAWGGESLETMLDSIDRLGAALGEGDDEA